MDQDFSDDNLSDDERNIDCDTEAIMLYKIVLGTVSMHTNFVNCDPHEEKDIKKFKPGGRIVAVQSNFGSDILSWYEKFLIQTSTAKTLSRSRERRSAITAEERTDERHIQVIDGQKFRRVRKPTGTGDHLNSSISIMIVSAAENLSYDDEDVLAELSESPKIYKIKLFRQGSCQIPGIVSKDQSDIIDALDYLKDYLNNVMGRKNIYYTGLRTTMENYTCTLIAKGIKYQLQNVKDLFSQYQEDPAHIVSARWLLELIDKPDSEYVNSVLSYLPMNPMYITDVQYNTLNESAPKIKCLRLREVPFGNNSSSAPGIYKITRANISNQGTITIMSANNFNEAEQIAHWVMRFIFLNKSNVWVSESIIKQRRMAMPPVEWNEFSDIVD
jgi:hypothetical protein